MGLENPAVTDQTTLASTGVCNVDSTSVTDTIDERSEQFDSVFNDTIRENLFSDAIDLIAINIQHGRELGIPGTGLRAV